MSKQPVAAASTKAGWRVAEWLRDTGIRSRQTPYNLAQSGLIEMVKIGGMRIIITSPADFLKRAAELEQKPQPESQSSAAAPIRVAVPPARISALSEKRARGRPKGYSLRKEGRIAAICGHTKPR